MQFKLALFQTFTYCAKYFAGIRFILHMDDDIISVPFKRTIRKINFHPFVKYYMQEYVGKYRTDHPSLWRSLFRVLD